VTKNSLSQSADLRSTLLAERDTAAAGAATVARDLDQVKAASTLVATDDEHDPEGATIAFDRAQLTAVLDQARRRVAELDEQDSGRSRTCRSRSVLAKRSASSGPTAPRTSGVSNK